MKTLAMTFLMAVTLTGALAARADEAAKPAGATAKPASKTEAAKTETAPPAVPEKAKIDWDKLSKDERKKYMKATILPAAKKMFASYDAKKYSKVTCATCHGPTAANGNFKMPNADLPKLPNSPAGFKELAEKKPEAMKFMAQTVKPTVAALLGMESWEPQKPTGFGCIGCHEVIK